ncbi:MAG: VacJ family lipoprotein [Nitrospirota bacterium]|nr:VacJ family lipoprotein [Nitrospirota bacterium]
MRNELVRWMFGAGFALGLVGLSGCATGGDSLGSLEAALNVPSVTVSVTEGDGRSLTTPLLGGARSIAPSADASEAPSAADGAAATPLADGQAQPDPQSLPAPQETSQTPSDVPPAPLQVSQAGYQKDLEAEKEAEKELYDPFAKAEGTAEALEEYDPLEPFNVAMFQFNRKLDEWVVKPVATVYDKVLPDTAELAIRNLFHNVRFTQRLINNLAQGKFKGAGIEAASFVVNTTLGFGGFWDFAKDVCGWQTSDEDTGQTLGTYGVKPGPYLVLPFLGSFTIRDGIGFIGDLALDPFNWLVMPAIKLDGAPKLITKDDTILFGQIGIRVGYMVNERAINIETTFEGVEETVVDLYGAVRNAYLQKRARAIRE